MEVKSSNQRMKFDERARERIDDKDVRIYFIIIYYESIDLKQGDASLDKGCVMKQFIQDDVINRS